MAHEHHNLQPCHPGFQRAIVVVLDSVGIGELPDAAAYGDEGSNTVGNIARQVHLEIPTLRGLGLDRLVDLDGTPPLQRPQASFGRMAEASSGKDSVTGHWELMGIVLDRAFPVFPQGFPPGVVREFEARIGRGALGNRVASGTQIIDDLGEEHVRTGAPVVYTSADSVFQIAAHEQIVPLPELYRFCDAAFDIVCRGMGVGRVIARPFVGQAGSFKRTANRRDFALPPPRDTLLDVLKAAGIEVVTIGKIDDLFAGRGMTHAIHTSSDDDGVDQIEQAMATTRRGLIFANLVDFDTAYGHRNDVAGYAANLERFDRRLARLLPRLRPDDLLIVTADHGNDPTTPSTDHSREYVPLLVTGPLVRAAQDLGTRRTFADVGQTLAAMFGVEALQNGTSFLSQIC
ncbi:MAG: phosphopentomutase [Acidobacteria bacterium]|nr:phosphopentomutase [Acidobacteriota bacterium]